MIVEFDDPYTLLQNQDGALSKMVQQTGKMEAAALLEAAKGVSTCTTLFIPTRPSVFAIIDKKGVRMYVVMTL